MLKYIKWVSATTQFIANTFYMDNGPNSVEAIGIIHEVRERCQMGNLRLLKFTPNNQQVLHLRETEKTKSLSKELTRNIQSGHWKVTSSN